MAEDKAFQVGGGEAIAYGALTIGEKDDSPHRRELGEIHGAADSKHGDLNLQAKFAEELHHYFSECIRVADQKAAFLFIACSAILAYLFDKFFDKDPTMKSFVESLGINDFALIAILVATLVATTFLIRSTFFAIRVRPGIWKSRQLRQVFWQAVVKDLRRTLIRTAMAVIFITFAFIVENDILEHLQRLITPPTFFFALFGVAALFLVSSAWMATRVVTPRLWPSHAPHMFWEDVYKKFPLPEDAEKYATEVMAIMGTRDFVQEKIKNCHDLAHLCHDKYHALNRAISFGRIGCIFTFLFLAFHFLGRGGQ